MSKINVAILGAGNIATSMAQALAGLSSEVNMYAVASRSLDKAKAFAEKWGFEKAYGSYEALAIDSNVDLIYVATPHSEHYKNTMLCLENGRNCLVEKAFCGNRKQAKELTLKALEKKCLLAEAMWTRYQPSGNVIRELLASGAIGECHYMESDFSVPIKGVERMENPALAGGALLDLGIYSITVPAMYFGTDIVRIMANCTKHSTGVDATDVITFVYSDGKMARAKCSFTDDHSNYARITGDKGYMVFGPINVPTYVDIYDVDGNLVKHIDTSPDINGYEYEVLSCKKAIEEGALQVPELPHDEILRMMGWMDSLRNHFGIVYPFEAAEDIALSDEDVWGHADVYDDTNPWDRSNTRSFLEVYDVETNERTVLATYDEVIEAPNWSHDGTFLTFNAGGLMFTYDLATGKREQIDSGSLNKMNNDHVLSFDGKYIAVSDESSGDGKSRIHIVALKGGETKLVTKNAPSYLHGWSSDGNKFCFCAERNGEYDIYTINADGTDEQRITTAPRLNDGSEYDCKDEYIYFNSVRTGLMQAWRMKADGSEQTQLTFDNHLNTWFPHISPDRKKIVMVSYYKGDLWPGDHIPNRMVEIRYMDEENKSPKTLMKIFGGQGSINVNSWSPDSKKFAFVSYEKM